MTLGFNFDMALHLPSSHQHSHHHNHHHSHQHLNHDGSSSNAIGHGHLGMHSHDYGSSSSSSSAYPIKYEPCEQINSSSSSSSLISHNNIGISHDFLLHHHNQPQQQEQQQHNVSSTSIFERDYSSSSSAAVAGALGNNGGRMPSSDALTSDDCEDSDCASSPLDSMLSEKHLQLPHLQQQQQLRALGKHASNSNNNNMSIHSNNHDRKRPYPCKVCPSKFGSKMELEEHQNSHTGQKPFECEVCKSRFNRRSTLWNHKRIHSDAKPFVCTVCHMQFKWKNSLKCHKEMHIRKNETPSIGEGDNDIRQLTYATAAKRRMLELEPGNEVQRSAIFSAAASASTSNLNNPGSSCSSSSSSTSSSAMNHNEGSKQRKKQKLTKKESSDSMIKREAIEAFSSEIQNSAALSQHFSGSSNADSLNLLMNNQTMRKLTFGNLDFDPQGSNFGADLHLDGTNLDFVNNPIWMQLWNNGDGVDSMGHLDFRSSSNAQNNSIFAMDDPSKMLTAGGLFDFKDTLGLHSPNQSSNAAANPLSMALGLQKPLLNIDLNNFNPLHDSSRAHPNIPAINHLATASFTDYSTGHDNISLSSQFHLAQNQSSTSASSTPSSNGHQPNGHLNSELAYQQPIDHPLLLNTNHPNDYILPLDYMTPTGASGYPSHDLPLSALTSTHDPLEHSPHSSTTSAAAASSRMFYHSGHLGSAAEHSHHPGCLSSQIPTIAGIATAQQMR